MAARGAASERMAALEAANGFGRIGLALGLGALHVATLPRTSSPLGVMPVQWHRMLSGDGVVPPFLSDMAPRSVAVRSVVKVQQPIARTGVSLQAVLEMVKSTAGNAVDADAPLMEAGVDSLGAVELRNQLQRAVGQSAVLSSTLMFDHPTARAVARHLLALHMLVEQPLPEEGAASGGAGHADRMSSAEIEVAGLSLVLEATWLQLERLLF